MALEQGGRGPEGGDRGRAVLFPSEESLPWLPGWSALAESVKLELVPGRHFTLTREPYVRALAERV